MADYSNLYCHSFSPLEDTSITTGGAFDQPAAGRLADYFAELATWSDQNPGLARSFAYQEFSWELRGAASLATIRLGYVRHLATHLALILADCYDPPAGDWPDPSDYGLPPADLARVVAYLSSAVHTELALYFDLAAKAGEDAAELARLAGQARDELARTSYAAELGRLADSAAKRYLGNNPARLADWEKAADPVAALENAQRPAAAE
jgi:hypothetical protein